MCVLEWEQQKLTALSPGRFVERRGLCQAMGFCSVMVDKSSLSSCSVFQLCNEDNKSPSSVRSTEMCRGAAPQQKWGFVL